MSCDHPLPTHVYAEGFDNGRATAEARAVVSSLSHAGVPAACITVQTLEQFQISNLATMSVTDLAVGNPSFVRLALQQLGVPMPEPCDYPACLSDTPPLPFVLAIVHVFSAAHLLKRNVFKSTLGQLPDVFHSDPTAVLFVKPATQAKAFSGECISGILRCCSHQRHTN